MSAASDGRRVALVTGGNRGIGRAICRQLAEQGVRVLLGARDQAKGQAAADKLEARGVQVTPWHIDIDDQDSVDAAFARIRGEIGRLDILVNNAALSIDGSAKLSDVDMDVVERTIRTNFLGSVRVTQAALRLMREANHGRIVNVSSGQGSFSKMASNNPSYRMSKAALNAMTCILADEYAGTDILINAMTPGWVRTHMGGPKALRSVDEGADTAVWLATLPAGGPQGGFFRDREPFPW